jgi:multiple sugar transport system substrate-binding protein
MRKALRPILTGLLMLAPLAGTHVAHAAHTRAQPITLTEEDYYGPGSSATAVASLISGYEATHPGVRIKRTFVPFVSLLSKVLQQAATHTLPDILILNNLQVSNVASAGLLAALTPYTKGWSQLGGYYKSSLSTATYQNTLYGLPIGNNNLALFYNVKMFKAAGIAQPPATWAELRADAKRLTHGHTYGFVFSATATDEATWQWEPFLWGNGGDLRHVSAPPAVQALTFLRSLVTDGSAPKSVVNFAQGDVLNQFIAGNAAMMENGPWNLPTLQTTKGLSYGIAFLPRPRASIPPVSPLGGEVWTIPTSTPTRQQAVWAFIQWTQNPMRLVQTTSAFNYLPAYGPAARLVVQRDPQLKIFASQLATSRFTAGDLGTKFPQASQAIIKAIQATLTGQQSSQQALQTAQSVIDGM